MVLAGTCASAVAGANYTFKVDGAPASSVTCPPPGVGVRVEPAIDAYYGSLGCSYREDWGGTDWPATMCLHAPCCWARHLTQHEQERPTQSGCRAPFLPVLILPRSAPPASFPFPAAAGYTVTSMCPSRDFAEFTCKAPACSRAGQVIDLVATPLCTSALGSVTYTVDGAAATTFTCPSGAPVTIVPAIKAFGGNALCDYPGPAVVVNGAD